MARVKILHTAEFYAPSRGGAQEVVRQLSELLVQRGHQVTVATTRLPERRQELLNGVRVVDFDIRGNAVRGIQGEAERYQEFLLQGDFDVMLNYAAQEWTADLAFPLLERLAYPAVLVPCGFSALNAPEYQEYYRQMPDVLRRYQRLVFHASQYRDIEFARRHGLQRLTIIPNGAAEYEFAAAQPSFRQRYNLPASLPLLLTVGSHTAAKGHRETIEAFRLARIDRAALVVIGNRIAGRTCYNDCWRRALRARGLSLGRKRVLLLDPPRSEVVAAYQAADLVVFPSNLEYSPLVLFEAMAAGVPYLSSDCGNAAEITQWGGGGEMLETLPLAGDSVRVDPLILARAIERLLADPARRRALGQTGQSAWRQGFTWEKIALRYEALYQELAGVRQAV